MKALIWPALISFLILTACSRPAMRAGQHGEPGPWNGSIPQNFNEAMKPQDTPALFISLMPERTDMDPHLTFFEGHEKLIRFRQVEVNPDLFRPGRIGPGELLYLELFGGVEYLARTNSLEEILPGTLSLSAGLLCTEGYLMLSHTRGRSLGSLLVPGKDRFYQLISHPDTLIHYLIEMRASDRDILEGGGPLMPPPD